MGTSRPRPRSAAAISSMSAKAVPHSASGTSTFPPDDARTRLHEGRVVASAAAVTAAAAAAAVPEETAATPPHTAHAPSSGQGEARRRGRWVGSTRGWRPRHTSCARIARSCAGRAQRLSWWLGRGAPQAAQEEHVGRTQGGCRPHRPASAHSQPRRGICQRARLPRPLTRAL
eukprot:scaffold128379_cov75-Phaeocystis_antarctica.AAC.4